MSDDSTARNVADKKPTRPLQEIEDLLTRVDELPPLDSRPEGEILGYDENGLPHSSQN